MDDYQNRRKQLMDAMGKNSIAFIPASPEYRANNDSYYPYEPYSDFYYLTGLTEPEAIAVLIPERPEGEYVLFNRKNDPVMELWNGKRAGQEGAVSQFLAQQSFPFEEFEKQAFALLMGKEKIYFPIALFPAFDEIIKKLVLQLKDQVRKGVMAPYQFFDITHLIHEMRLIKSASEIAVMKRAAEISAKAHIEAMVACTQARYEYELDATLFYHFRKAGAEGVAYQSIVGSGENTCILHYHENSAALTEGDLVLIDAGCRYQRYCSDITRTFPINGVFSREQAQIYDIVLHAQQAVIDAVKPGIAWDALHQIAVRRITEGLVDLGLLSGDVDALIENKKYASFYMHNTGHWLGLDTHDTGQYRQNGKWRYLRAGQVLTVEPGIYIRKGQEGISERWWNIGVRIEDDVLVTEKGCEVLTALAPKTRSEIENLMARAKREKKS